MRTHLLRNMLCQPFHASLNQTFSAGQMKFISSGDKSITKKEPFTNNGYKE
jgi:hypothetical protein